MTNKRPNNSPPPLLPPEVLGRAADTLRILAHRHRLEIVDLLLNRRLTVGELATQLKLPPNAVSQHLNQMKSHQILKAERQGKSVFYRVIDPRAKTVLDCIREHCSKE